MTHEFKVSVKPKGSDELLAGKIVFTPTFISWTVPQNALGARGGRFNIFDIAKVVKSEKGLPRVKFRVVHAKGTQEKTFYFDNSKDQKTFYDWVHQAIEAKNGNVEAKTLKKAQVEHIQELGKNEDLKKLHQDLVPEIVPEKEFWTNHKLRQTPEGRFSRNRVVTPPLETMSLDPGVSAAFLQEIRQVMHQDSQDIIKVKLTPTIINTIFKMYPAVKRKYDENVPKISEEKFWKNFIESMILYEAQEELKVKDAEVTFVDCLTSEEEKYSNMLAERKRTYSQCTQAFETGTLAEEGYMGPQDKEVDVKLRLVNAKSGLILQRECNKNAVIDAHNDDLTCKMYQSKRLHISYADRYCTSFSATPVESNRIVVDETSYISTIRNWKPNLYNAAVTRKYSKEVFEELNTQNEVFENNNAEISSSSQERILRYQKFVQEILRHYWGCHTSSKLSTQVDIDKLNTLADRLKKIRKKIVDKLKSFPENEAHVCNGVISCIDKALSHYNEEIKELKYEKECRPAVMQRNI